LTKGTNTRLERRRRRRPNVAESEILTAAENFLRKFRFRELTVEKLMTRTGLTRSSFYYHFRDQGHLVIKLTERLGQRNRALAERWVAGHESVPDLCGVIRDLTDFYVSEGPLLRALSDAASNDHLVEVAYRQMLDSLIQATAEKIRVEMECGTTPIKDLAPREIATALLLMNEAYFIEKLGRQPQAKPTVVAHTLQTIWLRVLYDVEQ
jgi:AcrR family transcriptional regulator